MPQFLMKSTSPSPSASSGSPVFAPCCVGVLSCSISPLSAAVFPIHATDSSLSEPSTFTIEQGATKSQNRLQEGSGSADKVETSRTFRFNPAAQNLLWFGIKIARVSTARCEAGIHSFTQANHEARVGVYRAPEKIKMRFSRPLRWSVGIVVMLLIAGIMIRYMAHEPLRKYMEREVNRHLKGYQARIGAVYLHPIGFSVELTNVLLWQDGHPDPPAADIRKIVASVQWGALIHGRIVAHWELVHPVLFINLARAKAQSRSDAPAQKRGWQEAAHAVYPFEINHFEITDGDFSYADQNPPKRIHVTEIHFIAENIRNVRSEKGVYPSEVHLSARAYDSGKISLEGYADFFAEPFVAINTQATFEDIPLEELQPLLRHADLMVRNGRLSVYGHLEMAPWTRVVHLDRALIEGTQAVYVHKPGVSESTEEKAGQAASEASSLNREPEIRWEIDQLQIKNSLIGLVNEGSHPPFRLFLTNTELDLRDLSNHLVRGITAVKLRGKFMGTGKLSAAATFRPNLRAPDLDFEIQIEDTEMTTLNDLWQAYGKFDVAGGLFSLYMDVSVRNGALKGTAKPIFKTLKVYEREKDKRKKLSQI